MVAERNIGRLLLLLLALLLLGVVAARGHDEAYGVVKKLPVLRGMVMMLSGDYYWRGRELSVLLLLLLPMLIFQLSSNQKQNHLFISIDANQKQNHSIISIDASWNCEGEE